MATNALPEWLMDFVRSTNKRKRNAEAALPGEMLGAAETVATLGSGMVAQPVAGLAGLGRGAMGGSLDDINKLIESLQQDMTYMPRSKQGMRNVQGIGKGMEWALQYPKAGVDAVGGVSPVGGAALAAAGAFIDPTKLGKAGKRLRQTVANPAREAAFPGIYKDPNQLAAEAMQRWVPESPNLMSMFGVSRADLTDIARSRKGNMPGVIPGAPKNPKGSAAAENVMTKANERRLVDQASAAHEKARPMWDDMLGWYVLDPMLDQQKKLLGPEQAMQMFNRLNVFGGIESPNLDVITETARATGANRLLTQGRWDDFKNFGGLANPQKMDAVQQGLVSPDIMSVPGRVGHQRSVNLMERFINTGDHGMESPKAPIYIDTGGRATPQGLLYQTDFPTGDAHFSRAVGLADVRTSKDYSASISTPELLGLTPWYSERIARPFGVEPAQMQPIQWGLYSPQTGVDSPVGAPKLEIIADAIARRAAAEGIDPLRYRDLVLSGQADTFLPARR